MNKPFTRHTDSVETIQPDEQKTFDDIAATMRDIAHKIGDRQRHTTRAVHAESHALVKAEVTCSSSMLSTGKTKSSPPAEPLFGSKRRRPQRGRGGCAGGGGGG